VGLILLQLFIGRTITYFIKYRRIPTQLRLVYIEMVCRKLHCIFTRYKTKQTSQTRFGSSKYIKG
jgi:hypothetical protein